MVSAPTTSFAGNLSGSTPCVVCGVGASDKGLANEVQAPVNTYIVDPLVDERWDELVAQHPKASVFHQRGWLRALQLTYGYEPFVLTSAGPGEAMKEGVVFCRVSSWITGSRAVSLPFADHCEPLFRSTAELIGVLGWLQAARQHRRWKYVEFRPLWPFEQVNPELQPSHSYCFHDLDLEPTLEQLFNKMHRSSIQRKIRRAAREGLSYEVGRSPELLDAFYGLLLITRKRLRILPQPRSWFRNLLDSMGDNVQIRVARKNNRPIASVLTLRHKQSVVYKYGCSNERFHNLGGIPFLFWKMIEESKAEGAKTIDFGRSDLGNQGLITFKRRFNTREHVLTYYRSRDSKKPVAENWGETARQPLSILPDAICCAAGRMLYRHLG
jgi:CelD/BcsL family acetyltransferase involved in cellulose biosynthesis